MRIVLQKGIGDCGIASLATYLESAYEDVYVEAEKIDRLRRCKSGIYLTGLQRIAMALGTPLIIRRPPLALDDADGLLCVRWRRGSRHFGNPFTQHIVALERGVVADPADGLVLAIEDYLQRERATPVALLMEA